MIQVYLTPVRNVETRTSEVRGQCSVEKPREGLQKVSDTFHSIVAQQEKCLTLFALEPWVFDGARGQKSD